MGEDLYARYRRVSAPDVAAVDALLRRPRRRSSAAPVLAAAAAVLVVLGAAWWMRPAPERSFAVATGTPIPGVQTTVDGAGTAVARGSDLRVAWEVGTLGVEVAPGRGLTVQVATEEAAVRVVGTGFVVTRDVLGTRVEVRHGRVMVACGEAAEVALDAGTRADCAPVTAAGLLARAGAQEAAGALPAEILATVALGLGREGPANVRGELVATRLRSLLRAGRNDEALGVAATYLAEGWTERRAEVRPVAVSLAAQAGDCARARAWAAEAPVLGVPGCVAP